MNLKFKLYRKIKNIIKNLILETYIPRHELMLLDQTIAFDSACSLIVQANSVNCIGVIEKGKSGSH